MSRAPTLYTNDASPPCRSVRLLASALQLRLNIKHVDMSKGEHKSPQYLELNPQHTVPTIDDNGFGLGESRAILKYLVSQYSRDDSLYPKDPKKRAVVDQRLFFDGDFYSHMLGHMRPKFMGTPVDPEMKKKVENDLEVLERILQGRLWVAGNNITIADYALVVSATLPEFAPNNDFDMKKYPNVVKWISRAKSTIPSYQQFYNESVAALKRMLQAMGQATKAAPATLYYNPMSAPCISVLLLAKQIGYKLNLKLLNVQEKEQLKPEFIKINPQHTIPTLDDNGFVLGESRTIMRYLVDQYAQDDTLYPKDAKMRALVDQRLDFDLGTLSQRFGQYFYPALSGRSLDKEKLAELEKAMEILNAFLEGKNWVAGDQMSIADLSLLALISVMQIAKFDITKYKNVENWFNHTKSAAIGYEDMEQKGFSEMRKFVTGIFAKLGIS